MKLLVIEDDETQAADLVKALDTIREFRPVEAVRIELERDFEERFEEIASQHFDLAIVDIMLEYQDPSPNMKQAPGLYDDAGFRCRKRLNEDPRTAHIPVIMLSVLGRPMSESGIESLVKTQTFDDVIAKVKRIVSPQ